MMKVFLDTNIFLEYFEQRREYKAVSQLLSAVEDGKDGNHFAHRVRGEISIVSSFVPIKPAL